MIPMGSVVVRDKRADDRCAGGPVVPDAHGHGQQPLGDTGEYALGCAAAVAFEVELALEGVVDRLDPLPDPADRPVPGRLVLAVGADQVQPEAARDQVLELAAGKALVADEDQPGPQRAGASGAVQQLARDLAFP